MADDTPTTKNQQQQLENRAEIKVVIKKELARGHTHTQLK